LHGALGIHFETSVGRDGIQRNERLIGLAHEADTQSHVNATWIFRMDVDDAQ
jgi:hypothetical protein